MRNTLDDFMNRRRMERQAPGVAIPMPLMGQEGGPVMPNADPAMIAGPNYAAPVDRGAAPAVAAPAQATPAGNAMIAGGIAMKPEERRVLQSILEADARMLERPDVSGRTPRRGEASPGIAPLVASDDAFSRSVRWNAPTALQPAPPPPAAPTPGSTAASPIRSDSGPYHITSRPMPPPAASERTAEPFSPVAMPEMSAERDLSSLVGYAQQFDGTFQGFLKNGGTMELTEAEASRFDTISDRDRGAAMRTPSGGYVTLPSAGNNALIAGPNLMGIEAPQNEIERRFGPGMRTVSDLQQADQADRVARNPAYFAESAARNMRAGGGGNNALLAGPLGELVNPAARDTAAARAQTMTSVNIPQDVRAIQAQGGPRTAAEANRVAAWQGSTQGRNMAEAAAAQAQAAADASGFTTPAEAQAALAQMGGAGRIAQGPDGRFRVQADVAPAEVQAGFETFEEAQAAAGGAPGRVKQDPRSGRFLVEGEINPAENLVPPLEFVDDPVSGQRFARMGNQLQQIREQIPPDERTNLEKELDAVNRVRQGAGMEALTPEEQVAAMQTYQERRINGASPQESMQNMLMARVLGVDMPAANEGQFRFPPMDAAGGGAGTAAPAQPAQPAQPERTPEQIEADIRRRVRTLF